MSTGLIPSTALRPCPFCGSDSVELHPNAIASAGPEMWLPGTVCYAHCNGCGAEGPQSLKMLCEAVDGWNRRASAPSPAGGVDAVEVKALLWEDAALMVSHGWLTIRMAKTPFGIYAVDERNKMLRVTLCGQVLANCLPASVDEAKAAAQADYEHRIRSALSPAATPVSDAGGEVERLTDKVEGLEADLDNAVEVAFKRGAVEWTRLNWVFVANGG